MKIKYYFNKRDLWIGLFPGDPKTKRVSVEGALLGTIQYKRLFILPFPCCVIEVQYNEILLGVDPDDPI